LHPAEKGIIERTFMLRAKSSTASIAKRSTYGTDVLYEYRVDPLRRPTLFSFEQRRNMPLMEDVEIIGAS
jgi:hypothetical protein